MSYSDLTSSWSCGARSTIPKGCRVGRPCILLLQLGVSPTDYEIPISKLTNLWDAEELLKYVGGESEEEVAEEYLMDLIDRDLTSVCQQRPMVFPRNSTSNKWPAPPKYTSK
ncbi:hypothetical protein Pfo_020166 [Paulownia fortunei]|nr:hypothetical protein Pfo_020166 [Paulownia fortunei]